MRPSVISDRVSIRSAITLQQILLTHSFDLVLDAGAE